MERVIRIQSQQSGNFSGSNNILDFNIPAGQYNMRDSYLELLCSVPQSSSTSGILLPVLQYTNPGVAQEDDYVPNSKWVKRSRLRSRQHGILEEIQDNDILRQNLLVYTHPALETRDEGHNSGCQILNYNSQRSSLWRDVRTAGSVETSEIDAPINIPLSQICELGKMSNLPVDAMGGAMLNLELNVSEWSARSAVPAVSLDPAISAGASHYAGGSAEEDGSNHSVVGMGAGIGATTYGTVANPILLEKTFGDSADFPYYTGQAIIVEATGGTGLGDLDAGGSKKITTINANAGGQYQLVVDGGLGTFKSTSGLTGISISGNQITNPATFSINVITANLVLKQIKQPVRVGGALSYTTWESERFSQTGNTNLQQTFRLPANCMNCLIMFPRSSDGYSKQSTLLDYRLRVNNIDVTNRAVVVGQDGTHNSKSAIHTDLLTAAFKQGSLGLRTLSETLIDANDGAISTQQEGQTTHNTGDGDMIMIAFPVNETDSQKFLEVILNCENTAPLLSQIIVYKQVIREVML